MTLPTSPKKIALFLSITLFSVLSCSKDTDVFNEAIEESIQENTATQTVLLSPINDAYIQDGRGFNQRIMRVQPDLRTSYLMFDLSTIDGNIEEVELQFTIASDAGDGTVTIHKGSHNDWSEEEISTATAPNPNEEVQSLTKTYTTGETEKIQVARTLLDKEKISFVVTQVQGNDIALASKESTTEEGPKLKVTYNSSNSGGSTTEEDPEEDEEEPQDPPQTDNSPLSGELKAFPTAEGFGRYATGGRGGIIVEVTNLNDSGPGSLREALNIKQTRTIVFKVSGIIECNDFLSIPNDAGNVTIAGQTAPGQGITIKGAEFRIQASFVILRHL